MQLTELPDRDLVKHIARGREKIAEAHAQGRGVPDWEAALARLEAELAHRREVQEISDIMQAQGWCLVWSDTLGEMIAFARDDASVAEVPGGIVVYTRDELEAVIGKGPDMLKLVHESKKAGAKVTARRKVS